MARFRLRLVGRGVPDDPYRVELPTYQLVELDADALVALVDVPDADLPPAEHHAAALTAARFDRLQLLPGLRAAAVAAWHAHLDERYAEHAGRFRPTPL